MTHTSKSVRDSPMGGQQGSVRYTDWYTPDERSLHRSPISCLVDTGRIRSAK